MKTKRKRLTFRQVVELQKQYIEFLQAALRESHRRCGELDDENWELRFGETKFESMRRG